METHTSELEASLRLEQLSRQKLQDQLEKLRAASTQEQLTWQLNFESVRLKAYDLETALAQEQLSRQQLEEQLGEAQRTREAMETHAGELEESVRHGQQLRQKSQDELEKLQAAFTRE